MNARLLGASRGSVSPIVVRARLVQVVVVLSSGAAAIARGQPIAEPTAPEPPALEREPPPRVVMTAEAGAGLANFLDDTLSRPGLSGPSFGFGGFVAPRIGLTLRLSGGTFVGAGDAFYAGTLGPHLQYWLNDHLWIGAGAGFGIRVGDHGRETGVGTDVRAGYSFWSGSVSPTLSVEVTTVSPSHDWGRTLAVISVLAGVQVGSGAALRLSGGSDRGWDQRLLGATIGGVGLIGVTTALVFGFSARSARDEARASGCSDQLSACPPWALSSAQLADRDAKISTALFIGGAVATGAGILLWRRAPRAAVHVSPSVGTRTTGAVIGGRF